MPLWPIRLSLLASHLGCKVILIDLETFRAYRALQNLLRLATATYIDQQISLVLNKARIVTAASIQA